MIYSLYRKLIIYLKPQSNSFGKIERYQNMRALCSFKRTSHIQWTKSHITTNLNTNHYLTIWVGLVFMLIMFGYFLAISHFKKSSSGLVFSINVSVLCSTPFKILQFVVLIVSGLWRLSFSRIDTFPAFDPNILFVDNVHGGRTFLFHVRIVREFRNETTWIGRHDRNRYCWNQLGSESTLSTVKYTPNVVRVTILRHSWWVTTLRYG